MKQLFDKVKDVVLEIDEIEVVLLVGSHATGNHKDDSDVDFVLICHDKGSILRRQSFFESFGMIKKQAIENYGACTSVRVYYENYFEIEFGFVDSSWIKKPLDPGTKSVLDGGYIVIIDKKKIYDL